MGGPPPGSVLAGQCTTSVSGDPHQPQVEFAERSHDGRSVQSGGWTVLLDEHDRVVSVRVHGWVPQLVP